MTASRPSTDSPAPSPHLPLAAPELELWATFLRDFDFDKAELHLLAVLLAVNGALRTAIERLQQSDGVDPKLLGALASAAAKYQSIWSRLFRSESKAPSSRGGWPAGVGKRMNGAAFR